MHTHSPFIVRFIGLQFLLLVLTHLIVTEQGKTLPRVKMGPCLATTSSFWVSASFCLLSHTTYQTKYHLRGKFLKPVSSLAVASHTPSSLLHLWFCFPLDFLCTFFKCLIFCRSAAVTWSLVTNFSVWAKEMVQHLPRKPDHQQQLPEHTSAIKWKWILQHCSLTSHILSNMLIIYNNKNSFRKSLSPLPFANNVVE